MRGRKKGQNTVVDPMNIRFGKREDVDALVALNDHVLSIHAKAIPARFRALPERGEVTAAFIKMIEDPKSLWFVAEDSCEESWK